FCCRFAEQKEICMTTSQVGMNSTNSVAKRVVKEFLDAFENRNIEDASVLLAEQAELIYPGNRRFGELKDLVSMSPTRYQWVKKRIEAIEVFADQPIVDVVYVRGTLYGVNFNGMAFENVRFIDRFEVG